MSANEMPDDHDYEFAALTDLVEICKDFENRQTAMVDELDDKTFQRVMKYLSERFLFISSNSEDKTNG